MQVRKIFYVVWIIQKSDFLGKIPEMLENHFKKSLEAVRESTFDRTKLIYIGILLYESFGRKPG